MDIYFKFKLYIEYIGPIALAAIIFFIAAVFSVIDIVKTKMVNKFFLSHGYERKLLSVSSVGAKSFYGWIRESDHKVVDDRDIKDLSMKKIKERYM